LASRIVLTGGRLAFKGAKWATYGWLGSQIYQQLKDEYGETTANAVAFGLPGLVGVDIGGTIDPTQIVREGRTVEETIGDRVLGPVGGDAMALIRILRESKMGVERSADERIYDALVQRAPTFAQFDALRRLLLSDKSRLDAQGKLLYRETTESLIKELLGFRPADKSLESMELEAMRSLEDFRDKVLDEAAVLYAAEKWEEALLKLEKWNGMFPEFPLEEIDVATRAMGHEGWQTKTRRERILEKASRQTKGILNIPEEFGD